MAKTIDERIVEMRFDNEQFEQGVAESRKSILNLQKTLDTTTGEKAFEGLNRAAQNIDLSAIARGVDSLQNRFSAFGIAGMRVIENLTDKVMNLGGRMLSMTFGQIKSGGKTRATNIENARFSMTQLLKDAERVDKVMENVDHSVTGTAYSMDQAAKAASVLVSSGFKEGEELEGVLKSIAGVTATANADYDSIAHIFQNIAGQGRIMGQELNEFAARGLNIAEDLAEYYREVKHEANMTAADIRKLMSDPKTNVSSKDFFDAMLWKYKDAAFKANETINGVTNNIRSALSRIGADFYAPLVESNNEIVQLLNTVRVRINDIHEITKPYAKDMAQAVLNVASAIDTVLKDLDVSTLFQGIAVIGKQVIAVFKQISSAFKQVFPPKGLDGINNSIKAFKDFAVKLQLSDKTLSKIRSTAVAVFKILRTGINTLKTTANLIKNLISNALKIKDTGIKEFAKNVAKDFEEVQKILNKFANKLGPLKEKLTGPIKTTIEAFKILGYTFRNAFTSLFNLTGENGYNGFIEMLRSINAGVSAFVKKLLQSFAELTGLDITTVSSKLEFLRDKIEEILVTIGEFKLFDWLKEKIEMIKNEFEKFKETIKPIGEAIKEVFLELFGDPEDLIKNGGYIALFTILANKIRKLPVMAADAMHFMQTLENLASSMKKLVEQGFANRSNKKFLGFTSKEILEFSVSIGILAVSLKILSTIDADKIVTSLGLITGAIVDLVGAMTFMSKGSALKNFVDKTKKGFGWNKTTFQSVGAEMIKLSISVLILAKAMEALSNVDIGNAWSSLAVISAALWELVGATKALSAIKMESGATRHILLLSVAVSLLVRPIKQLAEMNWDDALRGVGYLALVMTELVGAMIALDKLVKYQASFKSLGGLLVIAASVRILASAMNQLAQLSWNSISKGIIAIGLALVGLIGAVKLMDADNIGLQASLGLIALALSLKIIASAIISLASVPFEEIGMAFSALTIIIGELLVFCLALKDTGLIEAGAAMLLISVGIKILASAIGDFAAIPFAQLAKGVGAFTVVLAELFMFVGAMDGMDALKAAASILIMSVAIKEIAEAINTMGVGVRWQDTVQGLVGMAGGMAIMAVAAAAIAELGSGKMLAAAAAVLVMAVAVKMIASAITSIGEQSAGDTIQGLLGIVAALGILSIAALTFATAAAPLLLGAAVMAALGAAMLIISAAALVFNAAMAGLAIVLPILIAPFEEFGEALVTYMGPMIMAVGVWASLGAAAILLGSGVLVAGAGLIVFTAGLMGLSAGVAVFDQLKEKLPAIADSLVDFATTLAIATDQIAAAVIEMTAFGIAAVILGVGTAVMAAGLTMCIPFVETFSTAIERVRDAIESAANNIDTIAEGLIKIGENGDSIKNAFLGMAEGMLQVSRSNLTNIATQIKTLGTSFDTIAKSSTTLKDDLTSVTTTLTLFQDSVLSLNTNLNDFSYSFAVLDATLVKLQETSSNVFMTLVQNISTFCTEIQDSMTIAANSVATTAQTAAQNVLKAFSEKLNAKQGNWLGENIMRGLAQGIRKNISSAVQAAHNAAMSVNREFQIVAQVHSPSDFTEWVGENYDVGLADGITDNADQPVNAAKDVASDVNDAFSQIDMSDLSIDMDGNIKGLEELQNMDFSNLDALGNIDLSGIQGMENLDISALDLKGMMDENGAIDINKFAEQMGGDATDAFVKGAIENSSSVQNLKKRWSKFIADGQVDVDAVSGESYKTGEAMAESLVEGQVQGTKQAYAKLSDEELIKMGVKPPMNLTSEEKAKVEEYNKQKARAATQAYLDELKKSNPGEYYAMEKKYYESTIQASIQAQKIRVKDLQGQQKYTVMLKNLNWALDNIHNSNEGIANQAQSIVDKYQAMSKGFDQMANPKVIPVVDMTNVEEAQKKINSMVWFGEDGKIVVDRNSQATNDVDYYTRREVELLASIEALQKAGVQSNGVASIQSLQAELERIRNSGIKTDTSEIMNTRLAELKAELESSKASGASKDEQKAIKDQISELQTRMKDWGIAEEDLEKIKTDSDTIKTGVEGSAETIKTKPEEIENSTYNSASRVMAESVSKDFKTHDDVLAEVNNQIKEQQAQASAEQNRLLTQMNYALANPIPVTINTTVDVHQNDNGVFNATARQNDKYIKRTGYSRYREQRGF